MPDTTTPPPVATEREAFEAWWERERNTANSHMEGDDYLDLDPTDKDQYLACWQAARASAPVVAPVDERKALEKLVACKDERDRLRKLHDMGHGTDWDGYRARMADAWKQARALLAQQPSGDEALMRQAMEELVDCPSRVGGYGKRSKVIAALRARLEGTK
jgi:hypothetical protein